MGNLPLSYLIKEMPFPFYINRMLYLDSNIPSKTFYASISSKILRIARKTTDMINFVTPVKCFVDTYKNASY